MGSHVAVRVHGNVLHIRPASAAVGTYGVCVVELSARVMTNDTVMFTSTRARLPNASYALLRMVDTKDVSKAVVEPAAGINTSSFCRDAAAFAFAGNTVASTVKTMGDPTGTMAVPRSVAETVTVSPALVSMVEAEMMPVMGFVANVASCSVRVALTYFTTRDTATGSLTMFAYLSRMVTNTLTVVPGRMLVVTAGGTSVASDASTFVTSATTVKTSGLA
mmetsp:Transcript_27890/g.46714  ORF Transcript_27890/g.46714 Transcript_27890/m.46714 type:complete len:220 (-) Transcript_27890:1077-1736(-)